MIPVAHFRIFATVLLLAGCVPDREEGSRALRVLTSGAARELDPRFVSDPHSLRLTRLIHASLVRMDPLTLEPTLDLASEVVEPVPGTYRVTLRRDLFFSDGSPLTSRDVVATFTSITDPSLGSRYAGTYRRIRSVSSDGPRHIVFVLDEPHATFLTDLEMPVLRSEDANRHLRWIDGAGVVGAGPYRLLRWSRRGVELIANPLWHAGIARFPHVQLDVLRDENTRALRLFSGEADLALQAVGPLLLGRIAQIENYEVLSAPGINTFYLGYHTAAAGLSQRTVREAIAHAIDRELLLRSELAGRGTLARSLIPQGHWADDEGLVLPRYDLVRARELLDAAGLHIRGDGTRATLIFRVAADRTRVSLAKAIAGMLGQVGLEVEVRPSEAGVLIEDLNRGRFDLCLLQLPELYEPHLLSWFFGSDRIPEAPGFVGANRWRFSDPVLDQALEVGRATSDREARREAYAVALRQLNEGLPALPLFHEDTVAVLGSRARGFRVPRDGRLSTLAY